MMPDSTETPRNILIAALFCAIIGIIAYAAFDCGMAGQKARGLSGAKMPPVQEEARGFLP